MTAIEEIEDGVLLRVVVSPRARRPQIGPRRGDRIKIAVSAPPERGAANAAVAELLARALGRRARDVEIVSGRAGREKTFYVAGETRARAEGALG